MPVSKSRFVSLSINISIELSCSDARHRVGQLLSKLVERKVVNTDEYITGLRQVLDEAADLILDVPQLPQYITQLIEPSVEVLGVEFLRPLLDQLHSLGIHFC